MIKSSYRDLIAVLVFTVLSVVWLSIPILDKYPLNIVPYILLLLILSGYSLLAALKPLVHQIGVIKRIIYSVILSFILTVIVSLLSNFNPISIHMFEVIPILTLILILIAFIRRRNASRRVFLDKTKNKVEISEKLIPAERLDSKFTDQDRQLLGKLDLQVSESKIRSEEIKSDGKDESMIDNEKKMNDENSKKIFYSWDLVLILLFTTLTVVFILTPGFIGTFPHIIPGLFLILFLPGYALTAALFPKMGDLDNFERLALSFGLSIAITPLLSLILNYTSYGNLLDPILLSLSVLTVLLVITAYLRRFLTSPVNRFRVDFTGFFKTLGGGFSSESKTGKIISIILIITLMLSVATTAYIIVKPPPGASFTEFYILGPGGKATDYPTNLTSDETGNLIIGIVNHENKETSYHLVVTSDGVVQTDQIITLNNQQQLQIPFNFTAGDPGTREMDFLLYKLPDNNNIYRSLHLWLNISASPTTTTVS